MKNSLSKKAIWVCLSFSAFVLVAMARTPGSTRVRNQTLPMFEDWTTRHLAYAHFGYLRDLDAVKQDPRSFFHWWQRTQSGQRGQLRPSRSFRRGRIPSLRYTPTFGHRDWSIYLGTAGTPNGMYPAKFSFDITATPSCANDFIVYPIAAAGSATQPNIAGFINLYSGTAGSTGICNRTPSASDTGVAATVNWSYNVQAITNGAVPTSPVISFDVAGGELGTKVAFVESAAGSPAHFHVLAFKSKDGQKSTNLQSVLSPKTINTFVTSNPADGSGTASDLALGSSTSGTDTLSSPFVDYVTDKAYVGNDIGVLYRIKDVFCISTNTDCTITTKPAPSLDATWGTGGAVTVCGGRLTGPVLDYVTGNVFVGCSDGKLYSVSQAGAVKSIVVGDGVASKTYGAIVDPPIVDGLNHFVYAVSGSGNAGANGILVQAKTDFSSSVSAPIGTGNQCNIHVPAPNNAYYTSITSAGALMYVAGVTGTVPQPCTAGSNAGTTPPTIEIYGVTFNTTTGVMNTAAPQSFGAGGGPGYEWAPLLEFYNPATAVDWLFTGALQSGQTNLGEVKITGGFPGSLSGTLATEGLGMSGMIVDNDSASAQAASIYFNALGENAACNNNTVLTDTGGCAVKLTQATFQ